MFPEIQIKKDECVLTGIKDKFNWHVDRPDIKFKYGYHVLFPGLLVDPKTHQVLFFFFSLLFLIFLAVFFFGCLIFLVFPPFFSFFFVFLVFFFFVFKGREVTLKIGIYLFADSGLSVLTRKWRITQNVINLVRNFRL